MDRSPPRMSACIGEDALAAFAEGAVLPEAQSALEEHLADCDECRAVLARVARAARAKSGARSAHEGGAGDDDLPEELPPGTRVGRYVVEGLIGRGAMGAVYAASDPDLHRRVAVKLLRSDELSDEARQLMRARLLREAQAMARLSHPEVITVHDVGALGDQLFVAMEYVEGETLRRWRGARHRSYEEVLGVYERAGGGLAAAHDAGLVHRDFKPDNVLVGRDGRVRVTDFGLARSVDQGEAASLGESDADPASGRVLTTLTRTGTLLGTPAYMAPEQLRGTAADARSDVFSFCVALYEALYGERPFAGASVTLLQGAIEQGHVRAPPVMTPVPAWLRAVLLRGLRAAPGERFASMRALLDALRAAHGASRRRKARMLGAAALVFGLASLAVMARRASLGGTPPAVEGLAPRAPQAPPAAGSLPAVGSGAAPTLVAEQPAPGNTAVTTAPESSAAAAMQTPRVRAPAVGPRATTSTPPRSSEAAAETERPIPRQSDARPRIGNNGALILE